MFWGCKNDLTQGGLSNCYIKTILNTKEVYKRYKWRSRHEEENVQIFEPLAKMPMDMFGQVMSVQ